MSRSFSIRYYNLRTSRVVTLTTALTVTDRAEAYDLAQRASGDLGVAVELVWPDGTVTLVDATDGVI